MVHTSQRELDLNGGYTYTTDYAPRGSVTSKVDRGYNPDDDGFMNLNLLGRITVAGAAAGAAALLLAGCSSPAETEPPRSWQTSSPENTQTPETPAEPALVTTLEASDWNTFATTDQGEQRSYSLYRVENNQADHAKRLEGKDRPTWTTPSIDMGGQSILDNWDYIIDEAHMATDFDAQTEENVLDHDEAIKILAAGYYNTSDKGILLNSYTSARDDILAHDTGYVTVNVAHAETATSDLKEGVDENNKPIKYKMIDFTNADGQKFQGKWVYVKFPSAEDENTIESSWVVASLEEVK